jgi:hypothetical protein
LQIPQQAIETAATMRMDGYRRTGAWPRWRWLRRGFWLVSSKDLRILERGVSFINPLKLLLGSVPQLGIGMKSIRMPYAHKVFIGLTDLLPRGIGRNA